MRGEVTNRVLLGRKSPGCPAGVFAAVDTVITVKGFFDWALGERLPLA
jgi:hypothetical protein